MGLFGVKLVNQEWPPLTSDTFTIAVMQSQQLILWESFSNYQSGWFRLVLQRIINTTETHQQSTPKWEKITNNWKSSVNFLHCVIFKTCSVVQQNRNTRTIYCTEKLKLICWRSTTVRRLHVGLYIRQVETGTLRLNSNRSILISRYYLKSNNYIALILFIRNKTNTDVSLN